MKYFVYTIITIVVAAVVAGFFIVGSPKEERLRRFDDRRVNDLQFLQSEIINYWVNKADLPENLAALNDATRGITVPKDPETSANYGYQAGGLESFTLCADFARPSLGQLEIGAPKAYPASGYYWEGNWEHAAGSVCFERKIDKDFYRPQKEKPLL